MLQKFLTKAESFILNIFSIIVSERNEYEIS